MVSSDRVSGSSVNIKFGNKPLISKGDISMFVTLLDAGTLKVLKLKLNYTTVTVFSEVKYFQ